MPRLSASPRAPAPQATRRAELLVRAALRARDLRARRRGGLHARPAAHTRSRRACGGNRSARLRRGESAAAADPHGPVRADRRVNPVDHVCLRVRAPACALCPRAQPNHHVCVRAHIHIYIRALSLVRELSLERRLRYVTVRGSRVSSNLSSVEDRPRRASRDCARTAVGGCISISDTNVHFYQTLPRDSHTQPRPPPARVHHSYR